MFERFTKDARAVVGAAEREARATGSRTVEAEHLLLALAARRHGALVGAGLDHRGVLDALEWERTRSLAAVGVHWGEPVAAAEGASRPRFGASAKLALERTLRAALARGDRRIGADHVLLGVLRAEVGTVPRALEGAGVDRAALVAAI